MLFLPYRPPLPDVQQFGRLDKAGLIGLLQHLLSVSHKATVLQHALVLLHLGPEPVHSQGSGLSHAAQHLSPPLRQGLEEPLKVFVRPPLR